VQFSGKGGGGERGEEGESGKRGMGGRGVHMEVARRGVLIVLGWQSGRSSCA
jgi:hypothetical protein